MGLRGEIFSTRVLLQNRTYFFNVKENRLGDLYLNVVESKNRDDGGFDRQSVILFADDLQEFLKGFDDALRAMEKEVRERRRSSRAARPRDGAPDGRERGERGERGDRSERGERSARDDGRPPREGARAKFGLKRGEGRPRPPRSDDRRGGDDRPKRDDRKGPGKEGGRRVVVKKR